MAKNILKVTEGHCVVKVTGPNATSETITLATDLKKANETVVSPHVDITGFTWTGDGTAIITVTRNSVVIATIPTHVPGQLHLDGNGMIPDTIEATQDIVVSIAGGIAQCYLRLKKVSGYTSSNPLATGIQP